MYCSFNANANRIEARDGVEKKALSVAQYSKILKTVESATNIAHIWEMS